MKTFRKELELQKAKFQIEEKRFANEFLHALKNQNAKPDKIQELKLLILENKTENVKVMFFKEMALSGEALVDAAEKYLQNFPETRQKSCCIM